LSIQVKNLTKTYGEQKAVDHISFAIGKPEIVGFLGPNGAGKSTTMKMITGFLPADAGSIEICGNPIHPGDITSKKKIGYLPESNPLYTDMYIREYLNFIAGIHGLKDSEAATARVIQQVGLTPEANKKIHQLSKGYKQRVGLAAALIHDPEVLILDEPTSGLDPNQLIEIREVIRSLAETKTILFSSHILQEVEALCDRVIIISKGSIVADSKVSELKSSSHKKFTIRIQFRDPVSISSLEAIGQGDKIIAITPVVFEWETMDADQTQKRVLEWSLKQSVHIESLQNITQDLESVFKSLTLNNNKE
jgi:ABC-2 type transport system ATP-binding protein